MSNGAVDTKLGDLLLKEYEHIAESLAANEEAGEKRLNLYLTLTGVLGAAAVVAGEKVGAPYRLGFLALTGLWFLIGHAILARLLHRNGVTDDYIRALARIRRYFVPRDDAACWTALPFDPYKSREPRASALLTRGGLVDIMVLLNACVGGAAAWLAAGLLTRGPYAETISTGIAVLVGVAVWLFETWWVNGKYAHDHMKANGKETDRDRSQTRAQWDLAAKSATTPRPSAGG